MKFAFADPGSDVKFDWVKGDLISFLLPSSSVLFAPLIPCDLQNHCEKGFSIRYKMAVFVWLCSHT